MSEIFIKKKKSNTKIKTTEKKTKEKMKEM